MQGVARKSETLVVSSYYCIGRIIITILPLHYQNQHLRDHGHSTVANITSKIYTNDNTTALHNNNYTPTADTPTLNSNTDDQRQHQTRRRFFGTDLRSPASRVLRPIIFAAARLPAHPFHLKNRLRVPPSPSRADRTIALCSRASSRRRTFRLVVSLQV